MSHIDRTARLVKSLRSVAGRVHSRAESFRADDVVVVVEQVRTGSPEVGARSSADDVVNMMCEYTLGRRSRHARGVNDLHLVDSERCCVRGHLTRFS